MCGISGVIDNALPASQLLPIVQRMTAQMVHRGPDDDGFFVAHGVGLGMRRLSIIDLAGGKQPIANEDGSVVVVFNGEIYNYREIAERLAQRGHRLATASDTEVIVHLYEQYGDDCVDHLRGMFAFALWDARRRRLLVARDRLGVKPLYYTQRRGRLIFASEIKALLAHPAVHAEPNYEAISHYLSLKYAPAPLTMFAGIYSLPPAHTLVWETSGVRVRPYWDLSYEPAPAGRKSADEYAEQLDELLTEAIRLRLRSDVPFGAFLSGGVDSSTVVAIMSRILSEPVKTFSVGFENRGKTASELPYARLAAKHLGTDHREILIGPQDLMDLAETVTWHLDQPIADQATLAVYMVSRLASQHVKMVLTGEGGDELFAGYARYSGERFSPWFGLLPQGMRRLAISAASRLPRLRREKLALYALCQEGEAARYANWFPLFNRDIKAALLGPGADCIMRPDSAEKLFAEHLARTDARQPLNRMLYVDNKLWLPDFLLLRGDKLSMANSLEAREPLLDHKLAEFAAALPPRMKLRGMTTKWLLKKVARKYLPGAIIDRKKEGFPIPISAWFRKEARPLVRDLLSPDGLRKRGLFDAGYVRTLVAQHESGFADHGAQLWGLMSLELWQRRFLDTAPRAAPAPAARRTVRVCDHE
jgi:asparagine synthase (glutamine-hydrolysing)